ncbi:hypothetical protein BS50DRAFT_572015 [Corynespora cassiicola Philippines]|uniref:Uncharacterized protein n=1 Tax=Corynespora cassiicola Philippines TaxID=1448308 RepID=A0A2T2NU60_CORCC|nr:hypothetical protein BS50DRAFT_572015 [Corynespora cassiicola Philippines]
MVYHGSRPCAKDFGALAATVRSSSQPQGLRTSRLKLRKSATTRPTLYFWSARSRVFSAIGVFTSAICSSVAPMH